jgi:polyphosphate kinase
MNFSWSASAACSLLREQGLRARDNAGLTPTQQWEQIHQHAAAFVARQYDILQSAARAAVEGKWHPPPASSPSSRPRSARTCASTLPSTSFPVLSPVVVDDAGARAAIPALNIILLCTVTGGDNGSAEKAPRAAAAAGQSAAACAVPDPEGGQHLYVNLEDVVTLFIGEFFPSEKVSAPARFRVSRNTDITVDDESAFDLASEMEEVLEARLKSPAIRIEIEAGASREHTRIIRDLCGAKTAQVYDIPGENSTCAPASSSPASPVLTN